MKTFFGIITLLTGIGIMAGSIYLSVENEKIGFSLITCPIGFLVAIAGIKVLQS